MEQAKAALSLKADGDLEVVNVLGLLLILAVTFLPDSPIRIAVGVPFVLFFPEYALGCNRF